MTIWQKQKNGFVQTAHESKKSFRKLVVPRASEPGNFGWEKDRSNREKWSKGGPAFSFFYIFTFLFLSLKISVWTEPIYSVLGRNLPKFCLNGSGPPFVLVTWLAKRRALTKVSNESVRCGGEYNLVLSTGLIMVTWIGHRKEVEEVRALALVFSVVTF